MTTTNTASSAGSAAGAAPTTASVRRAAPIADPVDAIPPDTGDAFLADAIRTASLPALLATVAHVTGDVSVLEPSLRPDPARMREPDAGYTPEQVARARTVVVRALAAYRDARCPAPRRLDDDELLGLMRFCTGADVLAAYLPLLKEELAVDGEDLRAPDWCVGDGAPALQVAIVGAGMSGLLTAYRLAQAGIACTVFEKNDDVGGTWFENTYPGCRVDVATHVYGYSFVHKEDWPHHFSPRPVLAEYFRTFARRTGVIDRIRFSTEVLACTFDEAQARWHLDVRGPAGDETCSADALVMATGQLNRPQLPSIPGRDRFAGPAFHSAAWDHDVDLAGKRVAVIGTGGSAAQFVPEIAPLVERLDVYQRTPNWFAPNPQYHEPIDDGLRWLFRHVPFATRWLRFWLFWRSAEGLLPAVVVDDGWDTGGRSVGARNEELRELLTLHLHAQYADRPDLLAQMVPAYAPASKRIIVDNGAWSATMHRDNVQVISDPIDEITSGGVRAGGEERAYDVLVYGTGFQASRFLTPMRVRGRGGADLHDTWGGDARAYLGITVPGFPNLFVLYGPNTNIVVNGSIIFFSECEVTYVLSALKLLLDGGHRAIDCRADVHDAYNARIDAGNRRMAWGVATVSSWYRNEHGRSAQNWPFSLLEFWEQTRRADPSDYELL